MTLESHLTILCLQSHVDTRSSDLPHILRTSMLIHSYQLGTKYCAKQSESQTELYRENFCFHEPRYIVFYDHDTVTSKDLLPVCLSSSLIPYAVELYILALLMYLFIYF